MRFCHHALTALNESKQSNNRFSNNNTKTKMFLHNKDKFSIKSKCENNNNNNNNNNNSVRCLADQVRDRLLEYTGHYQAVPQVRNEEVLALRTKFPTKIPIVIKRFQNETQLPHLDKYKFLVPQEITMSQFQTIIRSRLKMAPNQALYLLINNRSMLSLSLTLAEVYSNHAGPDGFLYVTYASQEVFG